MGTLTKLLKALDTYRPVSIAYTKADGTESRRTIEAYDIRISDSGDIYVKALDREKNASRSFRLDRIRSVALKRGRVSFSTRMRINNADPQELSV